MNFDNPKASTSPNVPSGHLSTSSGCSTNEACEGRDSGHNSIKWKFYSAPEDGSLISESSSATNGWDEIHAENAQELDPNSESLDTHTVRHITKDENNNMADLKDSKSTQMRLNIMKDDSVMRSCTFAMEFNDFPNTVTANHQAPTPIDHGVDNSSGGFQHIDLSARAVGIDNSSEPNHDEEPDLVEETTSSVDHANTRTRRSRIRSTTRAGVARWTAGDLHIAQEMRRQGRTMAQIVAALNRSENSVTGKLWRARGNDAHRSDKRHRDGDS